jgi:intein/homing endonuclease
VTLLPVLQRGFFFEENMNELTETQKAYLAGFFDGEGCVSIGKYQGKHNRTPVYQLMIVIAQKVVMLPELCKMTGVGSVHAKRDKNGQVYQQWRMSPRDGVDFLKAILPYLKNKQMEARIAIEFQSKQGHKNNTVGIGWIVPKELIAEKERYYQTLRSLKGTSGGNGGRGAPKKRE